ncbi:unnamed protein product, partial [Nesidiocoris tenuis]
RENVHIWQRSAPISSIMFHPPYLFWQSAFPPSDQGIWRNVSTRHQTSIKIRMPVNVSGGPVTRRERIGKPHFFAMVWYLRSRKPLILRERDGDGKLGVATPSWRRKLKFFYRAAVASKTNFQTAHMSRPSTVNRSAWVFLGFCHNNDTIVWDPDYLWACSMKSVLDCPRLVSSRRPLIAGIVTLRPVFTSLPIWLLRTPPTWRPP